MYGLTECIINKQTNKQTIVIMEVTQPNTLAMSTIQIIAKVT